MTAIGNYAFYSCSKLTNIELPDGLLSIEEFAFRDDESTMTIKVPASVIHLEHLAIDPWIKLMKTPSGSYAEAYAQEMDIPVENY